MLLGAEMKKYKLWFLIAAGFWCYIVFGLLSLMLFGVTYLYGSESGGSYVAQAITAAMGAVAFSFCTIEDCHIKPEYKTKGNY